MRPLRILLVLGLAANLGLLWLYYTPSPKSLQGDEFHYVGMATRLAAGQAVEPSPFWPPLYGVLMGRIFAVTGVRLPIVQGLQILLWLCAGLMLHRIASALARDVRAADVTAALFLLSPELLAFSHFFWPEMLHLFLMVAAFWLMVCHARSLVALATSGMLLGLASLTKLLLAPLLPLVPVAFALCAAMPWRARLGRACLVAGAIALTLAPTIAENVASDGRLLGADSSALVVWLGLSPTPDHPRALREFMAAGPDMPARNAVYRAKALALIREQGIVATLRNQLARQPFSLLSYETWFTLQLPGAPPVMRGRYQFDAPALTTLLHILAHVAHAVLLAGMAFGVAALRPRGAGWWNVLLAFLVYNGALYLVVNTNARYFVQIMPAAMLFAGVGLATLAGRMRGDAASGPCFASTRARLVVGGGLAVLLEWVAFRNLPAWGV